MFKQLTVKCSFVESVPDCDVLFVTVGLFRMFLSYILNAVLSHRTNKHFNILFFHT